MPVVIGVNPVGRRRKKTRSKTTKKRTVKKRVAAKRNPATKPKGKKVMAKKRGRKKSSGGRRVIYRTRTKVVNRYRKMRASKKVLKRRSSTTSDALNLGRMFRAAGAVSIGMIVAKVAVNKLTEGGSEKVAWTWPNIFMAAGSSIVAAFVLGAFGMKKPTVALVAVGGVGLALYKTFTCKIAPKWGWTEDWFGEDLPALPSASPELEVAEFEPAVSGMGQGGGQLVARNPYMGSGGGGQLVARNPNMGENEYQRIARSARAQYATGGMM